MITAPRQARNNPDRFTECQSALEDRVLELWSDAVISGWDRDEVLAAIVEIADNTTLALHSEQQTFVALALAKMQKKL